MKNRFWVSRTDKAAQKFFMEELLSGKLRQGWGYDHAQDLRLVLQKQVDGRKLEAHEQVVMRHRHMAGQGGGWKVGDIIIVPNLPTHGHFSIAKVSGGYRFEIAEDHSDYGHIREVELLTGKHGIAKSSILVDSGLRKTLRNAGRTWNVDHLASAIEKLIENLDDSILLSDATNVERTQAALDLAISPAVEVLKEVFKVGLTSALKHAEWEGVIAQALKSKFPTAEIEATGGPGEKGADIEIKFPTPFEMPRWVVVAQVKDWDGVASSLNLAEQLKTAIETRQIQNEARTEQHVIGALAIITRAKISSDLKLAFDKVALETRVPVSILTGDELYQLILSSYLSNQG